MPDRLRLGLAGCGAVARHVHLPLLKSRNDVHLVAVADNDGAALETTVRDFRGIRPFASLEDMLAESELDALILALPTAQHADAACSAFDAGLHVYIEKPLATNVEEAESVVEAWRRCDRVGVVGFNCRVNPLLVRMRDLIRAGRVGSTVYIRTVFASAARAQPEWKRQRATGGGVLLDLGAHHIDLIRFLTGREIAGARASLMSRTSEHDTALLELQLDDGVGVHAFFSFAASEMEQVEVHGDAARLRVDRFTSLDVHVIDNPGPGQGPLGRALRQAGALRHLPRSFTTRRAPWREPGYAILLDRFVAAARTNKPAAGLPTVADGFACAAAIAAAERSFVTGRMETPSPVPLSIQLHYR